MTDSQSNYLDMIIVVSDFYSDNQTTIDTVPALTTGFGSLATARAAINAAVAGQSANSKGVTENKADLRNALDLLAYTIMAPAKAWAIETDNTEFSEEFNYALSSIQRIKDDTIGSFCTHRIEIVNANIATMGDYGVTQPQVDAWSDAVDDYNAVVGAPREATNTKSLYTESLKNLFSDVRTLFKEKLDPLMTPFLLSEPDLYKGYRRSRIIVNRKGSGTDDKGTAKVFGLVTDLSTGDPLADVTMLLEPTGNEQQTDTTGAYEFSELPAQEYTLTASKTGYLSYEETFTLIDDQAKELNITMKSTS